MYECAQRTKILESEMSKIMKEKMELEQYTREDRELIHAYEQRYRYQEALGDLHIRIDNWETDMKVGLVVRTTLWCSRMRTVAPKHA